MDIGPIILGAVRVTLKHDGTVGTILLTRQTGQVVNQADGTRPSTSFLTSLFNKNCEFLMALKNRSGAPALCEKFTVWNSRYLAGKFLVWQPRQSAVVKGSITANLM